jgi:vesicular inhibitory amino acid transporter
VAVLAAVVACAAADPHRSAFAARGVPPPAHHAVSWSIVRSLGIFAVSVSGHSSLPALRASMADPSAFPSVVNTAFTFMALLYGGVAAVGYFYFGDKARMVVTASLARDSPFAGRDLFSVPGLTLDGAVGAFVLLNAVTTYPALVMIVQETLWAAVAPARVANPRRLRPGPRLGLRLAVAAVSSIVAVGAYASIANALALLGGASSMSASLLLPVAAYARLAARDAVGLSRPRKVGLASLFFFGVCVTVAVVWQAAGDLLADIRRKGGGGGGPKDGVRWLAGGLMF